MILEIIEDKGISDTSNKFGIPLRNLAEHCQKQKRKGISNTATTPVAPALPWFGSFVRIMFIVDFLYHSKYFQGFVGCYLGLKILSVVISAQISILLYFKSLLRTPLKFIS